MRWQWVAVCWLVLPLAAGCGGDSGSAANVVGTWWADELDGEPIEIDRNTTELPWFEITDSAINGNLGRNAAGGSYELRDSRLFVPELTSTQEQCGIPDGSEIMVPTERFLREMLTSSGAEVTVSGDTMRWTRDGHTITFTSATGEPPPPSTPPPQEFGRLRCAPGVVVEERRPADSRTPAEIAVEVDPATVSVEEDQPLQWWGYDEQGDVTVGIFLGDAPGAGYQVVWCFRIADLVARAPVSFSTSI